MSLIINSLLEKHAEEMPIHTITGWNKADVRHAGGWQRHLSLVTGVHGWSWLSYRAFLLIDEAQETYWDDELWAAFFKSVEPGSNPYIILFTSYCVPNTGSPYLYERKYVTVPMSFAAEQQISLLPSNHEMWPWNSVSLLLSRDEAKCLVAKAILGVESSSVGLTDSFQEGIFRCSNGHIGVLKSLVEILLLSEVCCTPYMVSFLFQNKILT